MMILQLLFADDSLVFFKTKLGEAEKLQEFLRRYELISGQQINFDKSGLFFSPNTTETDRSRLMETFGVRQCHNVETYLGLPTHIDRAKKKTPFNYIKECISKQTNGWYGKILSRVGKETLIKFVGQAVPTYAMSVFKLLPQVCKETEILLNKFFFGIMAERVRG